jgi:diguanylate cyclase (GGDEF)-like protein
MLWSVLYFILKPLRAIEKTARDVQAKRFEPILYRPSAPELANVVTAMNQMSHHVGEMLNAETAKAQALHKKAYQDELTGLLNRAGFDLALSELLAAEHHFALGSVMSIELDDLRLLIRAHGFGAGTSVMRAVTQSAASVFALVPLAILARSNEFSFTFVADTLTELQATEMATELQRRIMVQLADIEHAEMVSVTMGVAFFRHQEKPGVVYSRADLALESARRASRNGLAVLAAEADPNSSLGSFGWRTLIKTALLEHRLRLLRQTVVRLDASHTELQRECMARLVDAQGKLINAFGFIPMASRHRLMVDVDRAIVLLALDYLRLNRQELRILTINLSPQSIADADFMKWFAGQLTQLKDLAAKLAFEVTKYSVTSNMNAAMQLRDLVHRHGGQFGIDNFSLDPQALLLLREIPPDYVKLTGSLIAQLPMAEAVTTLLQSFVKLAHTLDVMVIAQQVESAEQINVLAATNVDAAQGYYFGAPT